VATNERIPQGPQRSRRAADGASALKSLPSGDGLGAPLAARVQQLEQENAQLREALASRIVIEQAKGILAERNRISLDEAFELLRRAARSNRMRIHTLAAAVVAACTTPNEPDPVSLHVVLGERAEAVDDGPNDLR
jgi:hypothetical protein